MEPNRLLLAALLGLTGGGDREEHFLKVFLYQPVLKDKHWSQAEQKVHHEILPAQSWDVRKM